MRTRAVPGEDVYPGLVSFRDDDRDRSLFFGREAEGKAVVDLINSERLAILYSKSGLGKSSLINAGVLEPLRKEGFFPIVARLTVGSNPVMSVIGCVHDAAASAGVSIVAGDHPYDGLWGFFRNHEFQRDGVRLKPVLVLDQFEELFTVVREGGFEQMFISEFADAARSRVPASLRAAIGTKLATTTGEARSSLIGLLYDGAALDLRILLLLREDFLAELDGLSNSIPGIYRSMLRLEPLTRDQARRAIEQPAGHGGFTFAPDAIDAILEFLTYRRGVGEQWVDPIHLQIVCQLLDRKRRLATRDTITLKDVGGAAGLKWILRRYYNQTLKNFPLVQLGWNARRWRPSRTNWVAMHRPRAAVRRLCETGLITRTGFRNSMMERVVHEDFGVTPKQLEALVSTSRLLRADSRMDTHFYELTHDALLQPIRAARNRRRVRTTVVSVVAYFGLVVAGTAVADAWQARQVRIYEEQQQKEADARTKEMRDRLTSNAKGTSASAIAGDYVKAGFSDFSQFNLSGIDLHDFNANGQPLSFIGTNFTRANLTNASLTNSDFTGADLTSCDCEDARFPGSRFDHAKLIEASFLGAHLGDASLVNVQASRADFSVSELTNADLRNATLAGADFSFASLDGADMTGATIADADFTGTAWWMARGWSDQDFEALRRRFAPESFRKGLLYELDIQTKKQRVNETRSAKDTETRSGAYNSYAWFVATYGGDVKDAVAKANSALGRDPQNFYLLDTRGYLYLQMNQPKLALRDIEESLTLRRAKQSPMANLESGEIAYHAYLAAKAAGEDAAAAGYLKEAQSHSYEPTYERLLSPPKK